MRDRQTTKVGQDISSNQLGHSDTAADADNASLAHSLMPVNDAWKRSLAADGQRRWCLLYMESYIAAI